MATRGLNKISPPHYTKGDKKQMYEYEIYNEITKEQEIIYGYSIKDAFRRNPQLNKDDWIVIRSEYVD